MKLSVKLNNVFGDDVAPCVNFLQPDDRVAKTPRWSFKLHAVNSTRPKLNTSCYGFIRVQIECVYFFSCPGCVCHTDCCIGINRHRRAICLFKRVFKCFDLSIDRYDHRRAMNRITPAC